MAEFGGALDRWLEAPYTDAARREAEFEEFCEATGTDPDAEDAWERFDNACDAADAHMEAALDAAAAAMEREAHEEMAEHYDTESDIREDAHRERLARNTRRLLK